MDDGTSRVGWGELIAFGECMMLEDGGGRLREERDRHRERLSARTFSRGFRDG